MTVGSARHVIMFTSLLLSLLSKAKTWYVDATFKAVQQQFQQLWSIHSFIRQAEQIRSTFNEFRNIVAESHTIALHSLLEYIEDTWIEGRLWTPSPQGKNNMCLEDKELALLHSTINLLEPFEEATKEMSSEKMTFLSKVIPMVRGIQEFMNSANAMEPQTRWDSCLANPASGSHHALSTRVPGESGTRFPDSPRAGNRTTRWRVQCLGLATRFLPESQRRALASSLSEPQITPHVEWFPSLFLYHSMQAQQRSRKYNAPQKENHL
ncbi:hypothetical protein O3P69_007223, partial [Scylla paramamosain]